MLDGGHSGDMYLSFAVPGSGPGVILKQYARSQGELSLGRAAKSDSSATALDSPKFRSDRTRVMSSKHAKIAWSGDTPTITDVGSTNGVRIRQHDDPTCLYECKVDVAYRINSGDVVIFGKPIQDPDQGDVMCQPLELVAQVKPEPTVPFSNSEATEGGRFGAVPLERVPTIGNHRREALLELQSDDDVDAGDRAGRHDFPKDLEPEPSKSSSDSPGRRGHANPRTRGSGFGLTEAEVLMSLGNTDDEADDQGAADHGKLRSETNGTTVAEADVVKAPRVDFDGSERRQKDDVDGGDVEMPIVAQEHQSKTDAEDSFRRLLLEKIKERIQQMDLNRPLGQPSPCDLIGARRAAESAQKHAASEVASQASHLPSPVSSVDEYDPKEQEEMLQHEDEAEEGIELPANVNGSSDERQEGGDDPRGSRWPTPSESVAPYKCIRDEDELRGECGDEIRRETEAIRREAESALQNDVEEGDVTKKAVDEALLPSSAPDPAIAKTPERNPFVFYVHSRKNKEQLEPHADDEVAAAAPISTQEERDRPMMRWCVSLNEAVGESDAPSQERLNEDNDVRALDATQQEKDRLVASWHAELDQAVDAGEEPSQLVDYGDFEAVMTIDPDFEDEFKIDAEAAVEWQYAHSDQGLLRVQGWNTEVDEAEEAHADEANTAYDELEEAYGEPNEVHDERDEEEWQEPTETRGELNPAQSQHLLGEALGEEHDEEVDPAKNAAARWLEQLAKLGLVVSKARPESNRLSHQIDVESPFEAADEEAHVTTHPGSWDHDQQIEVDQDMTDKEACARLGSIDKEKPRFEHTNAASLKPIYLFDSDDEDAYARSEPNANFDDDDDDECELAASAPGSENTGDSMEGSKTKTGEDAEDQVEKAKSPHHWSTQSSPANPPPGLDRAAGLSRKRRFSETEMDSLDAVADSFEAVEPDATTQGHPASSARNDYGPLPGSYQGSPKRRRFHIPFNKTFAAGVLTGAVGVIAGLSALDSFLGPA
ncbi:hypothetical protein JCM3774_006611 [Rhodotorula dairenensis]